MSKIYSVKAVRALAVRCTLISCLTLPILLGSVASVAARDRTIPRCSEAQLAAMRVLLPEYIDGYRAISDRMGPITVEDFAAHTDEVDELIADMHELQLQWRREGEGQIPDCVLSADISMRLGRLLDETLISFLCFSMQVMRHSQTGTLTRCLNSPMIWHGW